MSSYPYTYYDMPIDYPDFIGKEDIRRAGIEGENDEAHLVPSTLNNTIEFSSNKSGKSNNSISGITKSGKRNNLI